MVNKSLGLFEENVEKDRSVGSIFGNEFHLLLMFHVGEINLETFGEVLTFS
jgi:hypothetical protein